MKRLTNSMILAISMSFATVATPAFAGGKGGSPNKGSMGGSQSFKPAGNAMKLNSNSARVISNANNAPKVMPTQKLGNVTKTQPNGSLGQAKTSNGNISKNLGNAAKNGAKLSNTGLGTSAGQLSNTAKVGTKLGNTGMNTSKVGSKLGSTAKVGSSVTNTSIEGKYGSKLSDVIKPGQVLNPPSNSSPTGPVLDPGKAGGKFGGKLSDAIKVSDAGKIGGAGGAGTGTPPAGGGTGGGTGTPPGGGTGGGSPPAGGGTGGGSGMPGTPNPPNNCPPNNCNWNNWGFGFGLPFGIPYSYPVSYPTGGVCYDNSVIQTVPAQVAPVAAYEAVAQPVMPQAAVLPIDLELLEVRQIDLGSADQGPAYRLIFRNASNMDIAQPFTVGLLASLGKQVTPEAAHAAVRVEAIRAGQSISVDLRLPVSAMSLGRNAMGQALPFAWLTAVIDAQAEINQSNRENDVLIISRNEVPMIEVAAR